MDQKPQTQPDESERIRFLAELATQLHRYGTPADQMERVLLMMSDRLDLQGEFLATPTSFLGAFGPFDKQRLVMVRLEPGESNLGKQCQIDALIEKVGLGEWTPDQAARRLREIGEEPSRWEKWNALGFALASGASVPFFGGGVEEMVASAVVGLILGLLAPVIFHYEKIGRLFQPTAAFLAAMLAGWAASLFGVSAFVVTLAGLIVLVPGLTLTVAMNELATRHLVAGSSRLAGAVMTFISLAFGVALGGRLAGVLFEVPPTIVPTSLSMPWEIASFFLAAFGLMVVFRARGRDYPWVLLGVVTALGASRLATHVNLGPELSALFAAGMVGLVSNAFSLIKRRPTTLVELPGLIMLVPGAVGLRGFASMTGKEMEVGIETTFLMVVIAASIVTGLLFANLILSPRREL